MLMDPATVELSRGLSSDCLDDVVRSRCRSVVDRNLEIRLYCRFVTTPPSESVYHPLSIADNWVFLVYK